MVNIGGKPAQAQQLQQQAQTKSSSSKSDQVGSEESFKNAIQQVGKNLSNFVPKMNANARIYDTNIKKVKAVTEELKEELPSIEDEAEKLIKKIGDLMEKYGDK